MPKHIQQPRMERIEEEKSNYEPISHEAGVLKTRESQPNLEAIHRPIIRKKSSLMNLIEDDHFGYNIEPPSFVRPDENEGVTGGVVIITERGDEFAEDGNDQLDLLDVKKKGSSSRDSFENLSFLSKQYQ